MKKTLISIFLLTVIMAGCGRGKGPQEKEEAPVPVKVMKVQEGDLRETLSYVGDIKAQEEIVIYSKVSGKLIENKVKEGDGVKKDDVLALIDRDEVGFKFEKAPVTSPIDGIVGQVYLDKGAYIRPSSNMSSGTPVAFVVDMDTMKLVINVIERDLPKVREGQKAEIKVDAYPEEIFVGKVDRVSPVVDLASRTALIEIKIPNQDHRLKSGMFGRVQLLVEEHRAVVIIPESALLRDEEGMYVFVVNQDKAGQRRVQIGLREGPQVEIVAGLEVGERIVIAGQHKITTGMKVTIEEVK